MENANLFKMNDVAAALPNNWQESIARNMNFHGDHIEAFPDAACSPAPSSEVHRSKSLTLEYLTDIQSPLCQRKSYLILSLHTKGYPDKLPSPSSKSHHHHQRADQPFST